MKVVANRSFIADSGESFVEDDLLELVDEELNRRITSGDVSEATAKEVLGSKKPSVQPVPPTVARSKDKKGGGEED